MFILKDENGNVALSERTGLVLKYSEEKYAYAAAPILSKRDRRRYTVRETNNG